MFIIFFCNQISREVSRYQLTPRGGFDHVSHVKNMRVMSLIFLSYSFTSLTTWIFFNEVYSSSYDVKDYNMIRLGSRAFTLASARVPRNLVVSYSRRILSIKTTLSCFVIELNSALGIRPTHEVIVPLICA
jgi:hypothetical protein